MTINLTMPTAVTELQPRIVVFGIGGAGGNAVNNMINAQLEGVEFVATNTDAQALSQSLCDRQIQLGVSLTQGLGAGSRPEVGRAAAEEAKDLILEHLHGSHMVFITAGMGGGTGTGAAPVIAQLARDAGILTVAVATKPFHFEGAHRMAIAEQGIEELQSYVDTLIMIPNQNLFRVANEKTTFADAFKMADDVLYSGVRGVTDLMVMPGLINLDFADIRSVMMEMGKAMMGTGEAGGERRATESAEAAISNPLLDDVSMRGARGVLINITGGSDMTLFEVDEAANRIRDEVDPDANIIFGSTFDQDLDGSMRVSVVATGIEAEGVERQRDTLARIPDAISNQISESPGRVNADELNSFPEVVPLHRNDLADSGSSGIISAHRETDDDRESSLGLTRENPASSAAAIPSASMIGNAAASIEVNPTKEVAQSDLDVADPISSRPPSELALKDSSEDHFIPPPAAELDAPRKPLGRPEPFAEAAIANAGTNGHRPSLLERMTGSGRSRKLADRVSSIGSLTGKESDSDLDVKVLPTTPTVKSPTSVDIKSQDSVSASSEGDLVDRGMSAQPDDDLLEIPAFLRRQAN